MGFFDSIFKPNIEKMEEKKDVEELIKDLNNKDFNVRKDAVFVLGKIGDTRAVESLINVLNDTGLVYHITIALGEIGDARAVEPLINAFKDNDEYVREVAAIALGKIGDTRAIEPLIDTLKDKNEVARKSIIAV
ncbi:MAG: HEAT repeat domain-containing protein [Cyanobacteriota bacterium]